MTGANNDRALEPDDRGPLRAAHADREHTIGVLKTAFVRGVLGKDEFDQRVSLTLASRTYAELAAVTADLPPEVPAARPLPVPAPDEGWLTVKRAVIISACLLVPTALAVGIGAPLVARYGNQDFGFFPLLAFFFATIVSAPLIGEARYRQRSRSRRPQAPAAGAGRQVAGKSPARRRRGSSGRGLTLAVTA